MGDRKKFSILIVDDDQDVREYAATFLEEIGYEVKQEETGTGIVKKFAQDPPDLLLLDYQLPEINGLSILRTLRGKGFSFPVVMLTASSSQILAVQCFRSGADDFIPKPFDVDFLEIVIKRTLENNSATLINALLSLMPYAAHKGECVGDPCECGMFEAHDNARAAVKKTRPFQE